MTTAIPIPDRFRTIQGAAPLALEVAEIVDLTPGFRRIRLTGDDLRDFEFQAGQDLMIMVAANGDRTTSRRYTIRGFDRTQLLLDLDMVVHHGEGPGLRWAQGLQPGDKLNAVGPRGKIYLNPDAEWHLFVGDESAVAATLIMMEAAPSSTPCLALLEIEGPDFEVPVPFGEDPRRRLTWLQRGKDASLVQSVAAMKLPPGIGHAYINGEVALVSAVKRALEERGLAPEQLSPKAYWGRGQANEGNGEPEKRPS
jgi:NADPH-dependent ferric siderophore reductase